MSDAQIGIFWDYENCPAPSSMSGYDVVSGIRDLGHAFGSIKHLKAYTEISEQSPRSLYLRSELQCSGVSIIDCPHNGRKNVADQMIIGEPTEYQLAPLVQRFLGLAADMLTFAMDNPSASTTTIMLISGDRDFAYVLSILRLRLYSVVVVAPSVPGAHISLKSQASHFIEWNRVIANISKEEATFSLPGYRKSDIPTRTSPSNQPKVPSNARPDCVTHKAVEVLGTSRTDSSVPSYVPLEASSSNCTSRLEAFHAEQSTGPTTRQTQMPPPESPCSPRALSTDTDSPPLPASFYTNTPDMRRGPPVYTAALPPSSRPTDLTSISANDLHNAGDVEVPQSNFILVSPPRVTQSSPPTPNPSCPSLSSACTLRPQTALPVTPEPAPPMSAPPIAVSVHAPATAIPSVSVSSPSPIRPTAPAALYAPVNTAPASVVHPFVPPSMSASAPPPPASVLSKPVPAPYQSLIRILSTHLSKGVQRLSRSTLAIELLQQDKLVYQKAGVSRFKDYSTSAETLGLVQLGGMAGDAWISLHPDFYGKV